MKFKLNKNNVLILTSLVIAVCLIIGARSKQTDAQAMAAGARGIPYGGRMATEVLCCNGFIFSLTPEKELASAAKPGTPPNSFFFGDEKWPAVPEIGIGMYRWWSPMIGNIILGDATPVGICLALPSCTTVVKTKFDARKMGTTAYPPPA
jgi:hypothetical protein